MDAEARLKTYADFADGRLAELLAFEEPDALPLFEAMRYAVLSPGKRVRPALCMASAVATGGCKESAGQGDDLHPRPLLLERRRGAAALDAGCAIELVHCFSLIHDDLPAIDDDDLRRGRPTTHKQFGEAVAILAGDALFALAFEVLARSAPDPRAGLEAVRILAEASGPRGLVGGEMADILAEGDPKRAEAVRTIHERKTAALIRAACEIGALFGGGTSEVVRRLREYGAHAGLAFQISDDLLNELSTTAALGKSAGSDRERQKATYPAVYGVETSKRMAGEEVERALERLAPFGKEAEDLRVFARFVAERLR